MKKFKKIPKFKSEAAERAFWAKQDSTEYLDWSKAFKAAFGSWGKFEDRKLDTKKQVERYPKNSQFF